MSTYSEIMTDSLRLIGVLMETESLSAEQAADGIVVFNDMMALWESVGIDVGHAPTDTPTDTITYPAKARMAIKSNLAIALCPHFDRTPSPVLIAMAQSSYNAILRDAIHKNMKPSSLDTLSSQRQIAFIESGP